MTALVTAETVVLVLLTLLVAGLLRSHAEILRRLSELGAGASGERTLADGLPQPRADMARAVDVSGRTPAGDVLHVAVTRPGAPTLLAFLTSGCGVCQGFWDALAADAAASLPGGVDVLVVTKGWDEESPSRIRELAAPAVRTVMSSTAWRDYRVPGAPYFVHVDAAGRVAGEGAAREWAQVTSLLRDATADLRLAGGRDDPDRVDRELAAAGIEADDPSLHVQG
jgi:hypothetical protein